MRPSHIPWGVWCLTLGWCSVMFWAMLGADLPRPDLIDRFAFDPFSTHDLFDSVLSVSQWLSFVSNTITAQFIHVDWFHLLGNVAYFFVFGVRVERQVGCIFLVVATVLMGALAYALPALLSLQSGVVVAGASGAVSGILGLYLVVCTKEPIGFWLPLGLVPQSFKLPAWMLIGSWLAVQLIFALNATTYATVAVATHMSGFLLGLVAGGLFRLFELRQRSSKHRGFHYV